MFKYLRRKFSRAKLRTKDYVRHTPNYKPNLPTTKGNLVITTVNIEKVFIEWIHRKIMEGYYPSRSFVIRQAIRDFVRNEEGFLRILDRPIKFKEKTYKVMREA